MSKHSTVRKVIAATAISTAIGLTSLTASGAAADGGQHEVGHWIGVMPPAPVASIHKATDVTMKRGVIGATESITVGASQTSQGPVARYHLTDAWPSRHSEPGITEQLYGNYNFNQAR